MKAWHLALLVAAVAVVWWWYDRQRSTPAPAGGTTAPDAGTSTWDQMQDMLNSGFTVLPAPGGRRIIQL